MKKTKLLFLTVLTGIAVVTVVSLLLLRVFKESGEIHIAFVGPMTGHDASEGKEIVEGITIYLDEINEKGGINGHRLVLDIYDDQDHADLAREKAGEIVKDGRAVAVIGHLTSAASHEAAPIYKKHRIPAITPSATNNMVNRDNPWYFRTVFNDTAQGHFLAEYIKDVLREKRISIIYSTDMFGNYLAKVVGEACEKEGVDLENIWHVPSGEASEDTIRTRVDEVLRELTQKGAGAGTLVLLTYPYEGIELVKGIRRAGLNNRIIGSDTYAEREFIHGFDGEKEEKKNPGFFTNGIYVTAPLIYDIANEDAQHFEETFIQRYNEEPDWLAAYAYDTVKIIGEAIEAKHVEGKKASISKDRQAIRDFLAGLDYHHPVEGITGHDYFDENGDSPKPVIMGVFRNKHIVSAMTQLHPVNNIHEVGLLEEEIKKGHVTFVDDRYMHRTNIVYTGIEFNEVLDLDIENLTCTLDFNLWFRWHDHGDIHAQDIVFLNAAEPVELGEPVRKEIRGETTYHLYRVKGKFKADFLPSHYRAFGHYHILGASFRHRYLTWDNLVYVDDIIGMGLMETTPVHQRWREAHVLSPKTGWEISDAYFFQSVMNTSALGMPKYLRAGKNLDFSRFNAELEIERGKWWTQAGTMPLEEFISDRMLHVILFVSMAALIVLAAVQNSWFAGHKKWLWALQSVFWLLFIPSGKYSLTHWLNGLGVEKHFLDIAAAVFKVMWWIIPAYLVNTAVKRFLWTRLEDTTGRNVPKVMRHFVAFLIYTLAAFGIVAFVLNQKVTGLLAASGVLVMVIGLAIQMNLSNIFSGIAINLENPFRIDDWVVVEGVGEAKVLEITWRSTRLRTRRNTVVSVPNSKMAESVVENYHYPDDHYSLGIIVHVDPVHRPEKVMKILKDAVLAVGLESPFAIFKGMTEWSAKYWIEGTARDFSVKSGKTTELWISVKRHLETAGMNPIIKQELLLHRKKERPRLLEGAEQLIGTMEIFQILPKDARAELGGKAKKLFHSAGEMIIRQRECADSLFVIAEGVVEVDICLDENEAAQIARLGVGEFFGETCLAGGERMADVRAITDVTLYQFARSDIESIGCAHPEIVREFEEVLSRRKTETVRRVADQQAEKMNQEKNKEKFKNLIGRVFGFGEGGKDATCKLADE